jgi:Flp pilus assembly protein TadB
MILGELRKMFRTVMREDCFVKDNVVSLDRMGTYSFFIALVCLVQFILYLTLPVLVLVLVFLIAGLFSKVLSFVFDKAVEYKLENDLTI